MREIEYYLSVDKDRWPEGPWQSEPDKCQWLDKATGLPCLIVRGPVGALCGYVGVTKGHPFFEKEYGECVRPDLHEPLREGETEEGRYHYGCSPDSLLQAHGGITFSDFCVDTTKQAWEKARARRAEYEKQAIGYPIGDAAQWLKAWVPVLDDYDQWLAKMQTRVICHLVDDQEDDHVWWFGFDCAHCDDLAPGIRYSTSLMRGTYRDIEYVKAECRQLAQQLKRVV